MKHFIIIIISVLTPATCWCQYFYKTYPDQRTATFLSIKNIDRRIFLSTSNFCDLSECGKISEFDENGNKIWEKLLKNNDVGISTLQILNDTIYIGGNYNIGSAKTVINRLDLYGNNIDEHIYADPLNRFEWSLVNHLNSDNKVLYFSGGSYKDNGSNGSTGKGLIYSINKSMDLNICYVDTIQDNSVVWDACIGPDSLLTCFIMENGIISPRDRRRIEKYDKDLNHVWKYQPPDSLLWLGNPIYIYGTVLGKGNVFFTYYTFGNERRLPSFLLLDTITKRTIWQFDFPNIDNHGRNVINTKQLKNGDILITGQYTNINQQPIIDECPWLMRIDENGKKVWEHTYVELLPSNRGKRGNLWNAIELDNGDIIACGYVTNNNKWDPLLIRIDADGCIDQMQATCPTVQIIDLMTGAVDEIGGPHVAITPNPASTYITIDAPSRSIYTIYNLSGQKMMTGITEDKEVNISFLSSGLYVVNVVDRGGQINNLKLQKL